MNASFPSDLTEKSTTWTDITLYLLGGIGIFFVATGIIGFVIARWLPGITIWITLVVCILNALFLGGSFYIWGVRRGKVSWAQIGFKPVVFHRSWLLLAFVLSVIFIPIRGGLGLLVQMLLSGNMQSVVSRGQFFTGGQGFSWLNFIISFAGIAIIAPISEELYFRGLIHTGLQSLLRFWPRVLLSSMFFCLAHIDSLAVVVSSFVLGVVNAIAYEKSKSIWLPICLHLITNALAVIILYIYLAIGQH